ncbi:uncharacterized protein B0H18DRAFT_82347 [Fomitopsis serialis]|uniref:uncharacterized protein n=1 Tax=Fomitopsis serialis TaxID=139415 RepID=UPI00200838ED|nr:uncharacterized protein B0H18DRAFT_82347 [Neoantrodia serialis]KAH9915829.1 hypothetical protein B0H18DRAFT_82347 [Neoantrodia serialis]
MGLWISLPNRTSQDVVGERRPACVRRAGRARRRAAAVERADGAGEVDEAGLIDARTVVLAITSASTQYLAQLATLSEEHHLAVVLLYHGGLHHVRTEMRHGDYGRWATANVDLLMRLIEGHEREREGEQWRCELRSDARQGGRDVGCTELRSGLGSGLKVLSACKKVEPRMTTVCSTLAADSMAGVDPEVWERRSRRRRGSLAAFWALVLSRLVLHSRRLRNRYVEGRHGRRAAGRRGRQDDEGGRTTRAAGRRGRQDDEGGRMSGIDDPASAHLTRRGYGDMN